MFRRILTFLAVWNCTVCFAVSNDLKCSTESLQASVIISLLNNAKNLLNDVTNLLDEAKKYASFKSSCLDAEPLCDKPMDCGEIQQNNALARSGVYQIWPRSNVTKGPVDVYCDMEDGGGGWTVIQRRGDFGSGEDYFYKDWNAYKTGFGDRQKDHWIGNDNIFALTNQRPNIVKFTLSDWEGNNTFAVFDEFRIGNESRKYTLHVSGYAGTAGDSFSYANGFKFSTKDQDNDNYNGNCAVLFRGAWWYTDCEHSNLNGMYLKGEHLKADGVNWYSFRGYTYSLKDTEIKIRPIEIKHLED